MGSIQRALVVGAGGLGCAAALMFARSGRTLSLTFVDPDRVETSNLHRQVLYHDAVVGELKAELAARAMRGYGLDARAVVQRLDPDNAPLLMRGHHLVLEGTDSHEAKFVAADAAVAAGIPVVHAGVVRWAGWALAWTPGSPGACLRCVFEELPRDASIQTCAGVGVVGSVVGVLGALQASLATRILDGDAAAAGTLLRFDALAGTARGHHIAQRPGCPACAPRAGAAVEAPS